MDQFEFEELLECLTGADEDVVKLTVKCLHDGTLKPTSLSKKMFRYKKTGNVDGWMALAMAQVIWKWSKNETN